MSDKKNWGGKHSQVQKVFHNQPQQILNNRTMLKKKTVLFTLKRVQTRLQFKTTVNNNNINLA